MWDSSQLSNLSGSIDTKDLVGVNKLRAAMYAFLMQSKKSPRLQRSALYANENPADGPHAHSSASEGDKNDQPPFLCYKLFREIGEECVQFPTYANVFGEPKFMNPFADEDAQAYRLSGIQSTYDGKFTEIPRALINDRFGIVGLLSTMRTAKSLPEMTMLSLGDDLTKYGFDMNSKDMLYCNFNGPYTNEPPPSLEDWESTDDEGLNGLRSGSSYLKPRQPTKQLQQQKQEQ